MNTFLCGAEDKKPMHHALSTSYETVIKVSGKY